MSDLTDFAFEFSTIPDPRRNSKQLLSGAPIPSIKMERLPRYQFDPLRKAFDDKHEGTGAYPFLKFSPAQSIYNYYFSRDFYEILLNSANDWILWWVEFFNNRAEGMGLKLHYYSHTPVGEREEEGTLRKGGATLVVRNPVDLGLKFIVPPVDDQPLISYRCIINCDPRTGGRYLNLLGYPGTKTLRNPSDGTGVTVSHVCPVLDSGTTTDPTAPVVDGCDAASLEAPIDPRPAGSILYEINVRGQLQ